MTSKVKQQISLIRRACIGRYDPLQRNKIRMINVSYFEVLCGMSRDQVVGALLMVLAVTVIVAYGWIVFFTEWSLLLLQVTGFIAVAGIFGILAWIGYTLATTPPQKPIEEIEKELKNLESKSAEEAKETGF